MDLTPRQIVTELDKHIVGQNEAKRSVAVAVRNRWRRQQVDDSMKKEISPKNIMMIGPTGVGKTEIARRLATLTGAPFIKVEATKYTEVGYYGRDVESMVRELIENALGIVRSSERDKVKEEAAKRANEILIDLLLPPLQNEPVPANRKPKVEKRQIRIHESDLSKLPDILGNIIKEAEGKAEPEDNAETDDENESGEDFGENVENLKHNRNREKIREMLNAGQLENNTVSIVSETRAIPMVMSNMPGMESMEIDLQEMFEKIAPKNRSKRELTVKEAREYLIEQESDRLINKEKVQQSAVELAENLGIIFIDEIDKIVASDKQHGADVSRQGVQRDLLPIVEGTTIQTKYGYVKTDHILFIAAGAFHRSRPSDLMPELQGRFPIRVELNDLKKEDFIRILTEPGGSLTKQYQALMQTENIGLTFEDEAIDLLAEYAYEVNQRSQNIGARRLYTIMEKLLEDLSFDASEMEAGVVVVNAEYVRQRIDDVSKDEDLSKFIL
ncbi:MAG: ATP-dependent protease ATPase subunit HslU [Planctomycetaceae bacterium]|jgi:ATP-dependent HslUV protease ATP-binding subunit HslU|nr:ATP-dependent protease ATPase subunit HslU [Planctomycetaceae bacterium]